MLFPLQAPALMPGDKLVSPGRHVVELEAAALIGYGIVRVRGNKHFCVHPDMAAVATQVDESRSLHRATRDAAGERKRQVEGGRAVHVNGVQRGVGAHHVEGSVLGYEQNVRNITAVVMVELATLF